MVSEENDKKLRRIDFGDDGEEAYSFHCKGCGHSHMFVVKRGQNKHWPEWTFNGDMDKPTFNPSLLNNGKGEYHIPHMPLCHLFLRDGIIDYLPDCTHELSGKKVPL